MLFPLQAQARDPALRDAAWRWVEANHERLFARIKDVDFAVLDLIDAFAGFCDQAHADELQAFFAPRVGGFDGAPVELASVVQQIRLCAKLRELQEPSARAFFERR